MCNYENFFVVQLCNTYNSNMQILCNCLLVLCDSFYHLTKHFFALQRVLSFAAMQLCHAAVYSRTQRCQTQVTFYTVDIFPSSLRKKEFFLLNQNKVIWQKGQFLGQNKNNIFIDNYLNSLPPQRDRLTRCSNLYLFIQ